MSGGKKDVGCESVCVYIYIYIHTHTLTHSHMHTNTHTHTYTHQVLVGLSGGKDSLTMLHVLLELQRRSPIRFDIGAATVDPQTPEYGPSCARMCVCVCACVYPCAHLYIRFVHIYARRHWRRHSRPPNARVRHTPVPSVHVCVCIYAYLCTYM